jgi:hypothetical protein
LSALLDDRLEPVAASQPVRIEITANGSLPAAKPELVRTYRLKHKPSGQPVLAYWLAVPMQTRFQPLRATLTWPGAALSRPVLVDLLDGGVYSLAGEVRPGEIRIENLPLADSPLVLCSRDAVELAVKE